jgi:hypothetical protein
LAREKWVVAAGAGDVSSEPDRRVRAVAVSHRRHDFDGDPLSADWHADAGAR